MPHSPPLDDPVSALEAHYRRCLASDAPLRAQLASLGLAAPDGTCVPDLGLSTRRESALLLGMRPRDRRAVREGWMAAGLLRHNGRERFAGCLVLPLPALDGPPVAYAGLPRAALGAPGVGPQRRAGTPPTICGWRTTSAPTVAIVCGDPFDALCCRVTGAADVRVVDGTPDAAWMSVCASGLEKLRPLRLRLLLAGTQRSAAVTDALLHVATTLGLACDVVRLPAGCQLRDLRRLHGAAAVESLVRRGALHLPVRVATTPPTRSGAADLPPWSAVRGSLAAALSAYLHNLESLGRGAADVRQRAHRLEVARRVLYDVGIRDAGQLDATALAEAQRRMLLESGQPAGPRSRDAARRVLDATRLFLRWATPRGLVPPDAATGLGALRRQAVPPPLVLNAEEVARVLRAIPVHRPGGLRDRAMLELFYATGIRRVELVGLDVADVDATGGLVLIRRGKGGTARLVPLGTRAGPWIARYVDRVRIGHVRSAAEPALFVTARGRRIGPKAVTTRMRQCVVAAGIGKPGSCHVFRHTVATLMHEAGADIRDLQALLGHALLTSTQLYTRVSMRRLQEVHAATHPGETKSSGG